MRYVIVGTQPGSVWVSSRNSEEYFPCFHFSINELYSSNLLKQDKEITSRPKLSEDVKTPMKLSICLKSLCLQSVLYLICKNMIFRHKYIIQLIKQIFSLLLKTESIFFTQSTPYAVNSRQNSPSCYLKKK